MPDQPSPSSQPLQPPQRPKLVSRLAWGLAFIGVSALGAGAGLYVALSPDPAPPQASAPASAPVPERPGPSGPSAPQIASPQSAADQPRLAGLPLDAEPPSPPAADPVAILTGWLSEIDLGPCHHWQIEPRQGAQPRLRGFSQVSTPFETLRLEAERRFGLTPVLLHHKVSPAQCAAVEFAAGQRGALAGPGAHLALTADLLEDGAPLLGRISGLDGRALWLALIDPNGGMADLQRFVEPIGGDGAEFAIPLRLRGGAAEEAPHLILVLIADGPLDFAQEIQPGAPAAQILPLLRQRLALEGLQAEARIRAFRLQ